MTEEPEYPVKINEIEDRLKAAKHAMEKNMLCTEVRMIIQNDMDRLLRIAKSLPKLADGSPMHPGRTFYANLAGHSVPQDLSGLWWVTRWVRLSSPHVSVNLNECWPTSQQAELAREEQS